MIFMRVDLPAPFSPSTAWICPGATLRLTRSLALTAGYCLLMSTSSRRMGWDSEGCSVEVWTAVPARAGDEGFDQVAVVGERHPREHPLMQCAGHRVAAAGDRADRGVPDADVGHRARLERADLSRQAERLGGAAGCGMQRLPGGQALAGQGLHLVGLGHVA